MSRWFNKSFDESLSKQYNDMNPPPEPSPPTTIVKAQDIRVGDIIDGMEVDRVERHIMSTKVFYKSNTQYPLSDNLDFISKALRSEESRIGHSINNKTELKIVRKRG